MSKTIILHNQHIAASKGSQRKPHPDKAPESGEFVEVDTWTIVYTDRMTGDQITITFDRETRDVLVRQLTDGIVLAGGSLPDVLPPR